MEKPHSNFNSLPAEILHSVLQLAAEKYKEAVTCDFALVCKAWLYSTRSVLYSNISIRSLSQLKKFVQAVETNTSLGNMVKVFYYLNLDEDMQENAEVELSKLLEMLFSTYLPHVEEIKRFNLRIFYALVLEALNISQLKRLKKLDPPDSKITNNEMANYVKCVLLLKDRIESICILNDDRSVEDTRVEISPFQHLYNNLNWFDKLTDIRINRETNEEIQFLENIVETCKSLKKIAFTIRPSKNDSITSSQNKSMSTHTMSNYIPKPNINTISCNIDMSNDFKMLFYTMHKFPLLQNFHIEMLGDSSDKLNQHILTQLLYYMSKINRYSANRISADPDTLTQTIGHYWNATSTPGSEYVKICYAVWFEETRTELAASRLDPPEECNFIKLTYPLSNFEDTDWKHVDFLQINGKYIRELLLNLDVVNMYLPDGWELPETFMLDILKYCPNLQYLYLSKCILKQSIYTIIDLSKKFTLVELFITECDLHAGMLEQLSLIVSKINQLRLSELLYYAGDESKSFGFRYSELQINMPHTKVDDIIFQNINRRGFMCLRVYVPNQGSYYYYKLDYTVKEVVDISEEQYLGVNFGRHINICCATKPAIRIEEPKWLYV